MAYNEVEVHGQYWPNHMEKYMMVAEAAWQKLVFIQDEDSRVAALDTYMILFGKATGMDQTGAAHFDESKADTDGQFATFADIVAKTGGNGGYNGGGNYNKGGNYGEKKQYSGGGNYGGNGGNYGGKPSNGKISESQLGWVKKLMAGGQGPEKQTIVVNLLKKFGKLDAQGNIVGALEDLTPAQGKEILDTAWGK